MSDIKSFVEKVTLLDVFLRSQNGCCHVLPRALDPSKVNLNFDFNAGFEKIENEQILLALLSLKVTATDKETAEARFDIIAEYVLAYSYREFLGNLSDDLFNEFTRTTALFNAYPYLREAIQTMTNKMGIPPVVAPLLKITPPQKDGNESTKESADAVLKKTKKKK